MLQIFQACVCVCDEKTGDTNTVRNRWFKRLCFSIKSPHLKEIKPPPIYNQNWRDSTVRSRED